MQALKDLMGSERGLFGLVLIIAATVLTGLDRMTVTAWQDYSMWIFGIYVGGKSITSTAGLLKGGGSAAPAAPVAPGAPVAPATPVVTA